MSRIIIRGAAEIEIVLSEGVEPPTVSAAEQARAVADAPGSSAATDSDWVFTILVNAFPAGANNTGGDHDRGLVTAEARAATIVAPPTVLDEPTVAALMAKVGDRVREAVARPPPPEVDLPAELALRRPADEYALDLPAFLDRRKRPAHG